MITRRIVRALNRLVPLLIALSCCSCGPKGKPLYPVSGHVYCNGQPAEGALVVFHPVDDSGEMVVLRPSAAVRADGFFELGSYKSGDGAPAGDYRVTVQWLPPDLS